MSVRITSTTDYGGTTYVAGSKHTALARALEVALVAMGVAEYIAPTRDGVIPLHAAVDRDGNVVGTVMPDGTVDTIPTAVAASRALTASDNGKILDCTVATLTLTVPAGLPPGFTCNIIPNGTTSIASSGGALLNSATTTLTRAAASNAVVSIIPRSAADSYIVTGT